MLEISEDIGHSCIHALWCQALSFDAGACDLLSGRDGRSNVAFPDMSGF